MGLEKVGFGSFFKLLKIEKKLFWKKLDEN